MLKILSLGAGVQSSTIALMIGEGDLPPIDAAIFADTQNEPRYSKVFNPRTDSYIENGIYGWLDYLESTINNSKNPFPIYRVTKGNLADDSLIIKRSKKSNRLYLKSLIPAWTTSQVLDKKTNTLKTKTGLLGRKCTADYKILPIHRKIKELLGIKRVTKNTGLRCIQYIGISTDEIHRMKPSRASYIKHEFPLIDVGMSRDDCFKWLSDHNYPIAPRSACTFCPFHGDAEWLNLKQNSPQDFNDAVDFERKLQSEALKQETLLSTPYLHKSGILLDQIDFTTDKVKSHAQLDHFGNECEGMCGV